MCILLKRILQELNVVGFLENEDRNIRLLEPNGNDARNATSVPRQEGHRSSNLTTKQRTSPKLDTKIGKGRGMNIHIIICSAQTFALTNEIRRGERINEHACIV